MVLESISHQHSELHVFFVILAFSCGSFSPTRWDVFDIRGVARNNCLNFTPKWNSPNCVLPLTEVETLINFWKLKASCCVCQQHFFSTRKLGGFYTKFAQISLQTTFLPKCLSTGDVLKNFSKFTGKHLWWSLFLTKFQAFFESF